MYKRQAEYITLNKSYRSTYEIITFARQFQDVPSMEAVKRHGEKPGILCLKSKGEEVQYIYKAICDLSLIHISKGTPASLNCWGPTWK